ncbi:MAG: hypothetical protein GEU87_06650 [Alphaproteobacteria bacterium]|nr:hypothetical protein [Alphaproteobacteria bacterium]
MFPALVTAAFSTYQGIRERSINASVQAEGYKLNVWGECGVAIDWATALVSIISATIGGAVAGGFAVRAGRNGSESAAKLQEDIRQKALRGILQGLHQEIGTLWQRYQDSMGNFVETLPNGQPLQRYYPVSQDFFVVYTGTAFAIGQIEDEDIRRKIVTTYTRARGLVSSFLMNNDMLQRYENAHWAAGQFSGTQQAPFFASQEREYLVRLVDYAAGLKSSHSEFKRDVEDVLRSIDQFLRR